MIYEELKKRLEVDYLLSILKMIIKSKVCPKNTLDDWLKTLSYLHEKGWLYIKKEEGKIAIVCGAYRIKDFDEKKIDVYPEIEEGNILYVPLLVSESKDVFAVKKMFNDYVKEFPNVNEIIFYERNKDTEPKRFKIGARNEQAENTEPSLNTNVSN